MAAGKRRLDIIDLTEDDDVIEYVPARKASRKLGSHQAPIELVDSDDETQLHVAAHRPSARYREYSAEPGASRVQSSRSPTHDAAQHVLQSNAAHNAAMDHMNVDEYFPDLFAFGQGRLPPNGQIANAAGEMLDLAQLYDTTPSRHRTPEPELPDVVLYEDCLARVQQMFPDIAHDLVRDLHTSKMGSVQLVLDHIIEQPEYPKQKREIRASSEAETRATEAAIADREKLFTRPGREIARGKVREALVQILKDEFPTIPVHYINSVHTAERHLYPAYIALVKSQFEVPIPYAPAQPRHVRVVDFLAIMRTFGINAGTLDPELSAARETRQRLERENKESIALRKREEETHAFAKATGAIAECSACFDETPHVRAISCNGQEHHFTCYDCSHNYVAVQVGDSKGRIVCPSGCGAAFSEVQLRLLPDKKLVEKFLRLQQEQDVRDAGIDDISECPFCDYKEICPPLSVDYEFRCRNDECRIVSCRKCQKHTHVPETCEEHARKTSKDAALEQRHKIEEAMTQALVRKCNKCKKPFIKDLGCNKMSCTSCGNLQCYVCSASVKDYKHFTSQPGGCPLHDNVEDRHEKEVRKAEAEARAKITAENPLLNDEDLNFKVSERVKADDAAAEARRVAARGQAYGGGPADLAMAMALQEADRQRLAALRQAIPRHADPQPIPGIDLHLPQEPARAVAARHGIPHPVGRQHYANDMRNRIRLHLMNVQRAAMRAQQQLQPRAAAAVEPHEPAAPAPNLDLAGMPMLHAREEDPVFERGHRMLNQQQLPDGPWPTDEDRQRGQHARELAGQTYGLAEPRGETRVRALRMAGEARTPVQPAGARLERPRDAEVRDEAAQRHMHNLALQAADGRARFREQLQQQRQQRFEQAERARLQAVAEVNPNLNQFIREEYLG